MKKEEIKQKMGTNK